MNTIKKPVISKSKKENKVLNTIKEIKKIKFLKIDTWRVLPMRKDKLYIHQCEWYEIEEVTSQFWRKPLLLSWTEHKYDKWGKEYVVYSPFNQLLEVYPKLKLAKDLVYYSLDNNIDFSKDSLEKNVHYKRESNIEKNAKKALVKFRETKEQTHTIRKTGQTWGGGNISKSLAKKVNRAHSKLQESALNSLKKNAILEIRDLSKYDDNELTDKLKILVLNLSHAKEYSDKYIYWDAFYDNSPLRLDNDKIKAIDNFIKKYCNTREKTEISEAFKGSNNMILKNYHLKYEI